MGRQHPQRVPLFTRNLAVDQQVGYLFAASRQADTVAGGAGAEVEGRERRQLVRVYVGGQGFGEYRRGGRACSRGRWSRRGGDDEPPVGDAGVLTTRQRNLHRLYSTQMTAQGFDVVCVRGYSGARQQGGDSRTLQGGRLTLQAGQLEAVLT